MATLRVTITLPPEARAALTAGGVGKGDPLAVAQLAGIMGAKQTSALIPLCHPVPLSNVDVRVRLEEAGVIVTATARTTAQTGVEMEALTAATAAALTVYDMTKALDKSIEIQDIYLLGKTGGKSGDYRRAVDSKPQTRR